MAKKKENPDFEAALEELEQLVDLLEQGDLSLDDSLKKFEHGVKLTRTCQKALKEAEQKVHILMEQNGQLSLEPFDQD